MGMAGIWKCDEKQSGWLTESLTRMNWSTSITGGALKVRAVGGIATAAGGMMAGAATTGTTGSAMGLFLGGRGMVDAVVALGRFGGWRMWWDDGAGLCDGEPGRMKWWSRLWFQ
jgi:hypothetical protein